PSLSCVSFPAAVLGLRAVVVVSTFRRLPWDAGSASVVRWTQSLRNLKERGAGHETQSGRLTSVVAGWRFFAKEDGLQSSTTNHGVVVDSDHSSGTFAFHAGSGGWEIEAATKGKPAAVTSTETDGRGEEIRKCTRHGERRNGGGALFACNGMCPREHA
ncbi:hypothetical protein E2320_002046, partial [Naja naja]